MADQEKHANDDYVDPIAVTSRAPLPPELFNIPEAEGEASGQPEEEEAAPQEAAKRGKS